MASKRYGPTSGPARAKQQRRGLQMGLARRPVQQRRHAGVPPSCPRPATQQQDPAAAQGQQQECAKAPTAAAPPWAWEEEMP